MVPQLKTLCGVKVVVLLSIQPGVKQRIFTILDCYLDKKERREELKARLRIKFSNVFNNFPPMLVNILPLDLALFIGKEIVRYTDLLVCKFGLTQEFSRNFIKYSIFNSDGTIDEELAARDLLKEPNLSTSVLFEVACYYCLEDFILTNLEKEPILGEPFNKYDLDSKVKCLQYFEEKKKYSKSDVNVNSSNFNVLPKFLFDLLFSAIDSNNLAAFKYVWKTVDESKEFQNYREFTGHKCIVVFNIFCKEWLLKLCNKIVEEVECIESSQFYLNFFEFGKILKFIFSQMTIEEIKDFLSNFEERYTIAHCILLIFLHWPYLDLFMDMAESLFCILGNDQYYGLMHNILDLISHGNYDMPYNYRLLLREFWIKSPLHLKKHVITLEQIENKVSYESPLYRWESFQSTIKIIEILILYCNFTPDDKYNFLMILKTATPQEKKSIFDFQGKFICYTLISNGDYKLIDFFLQSLNVDDETQQSFKKDLIINNFPEVMELQSLNLKTKLIKWAVGSGEDKTIKQEIFSLCFEFNRTAYLYMESDIVILFLDEIFQLLLNKDEFAEWKQNGVFDVEFVKSLVHIYLPDRFDQFLKWICNTEGELSERKENLLLIILENGLCLHKPKGKLTDMIFYLCSNNREKISEFVITLLAVLETYAEKNTCHRCNNDENLYFDRNESVLMCRVHYSGVITFETIDYIHSYFIKELDSLDAEREKEGNNFESSCNEVHISGVFCGADS